MTSGRYRRLERLFDAASGLPEEQVETFLERECGDDSTLEQELRSLLRFHREAGPLDRDSLPVRLVAASDTEPASR